MKIAIPVKTDKENPPLSLLFGKAKWFAIVDKGNVTIERNLFQHGRAVVDWLVSINVNIIIFQEMGLTPYEMIKQTDTIDLFHAGFERILLNDALEKFYAEELTEIDDTNIETIIEHHKGKHSHGKKHY